MFHKLKAGIALQIAVAVGLSVLVIFFLALVGLDTRNVAKRIIDTRTEIDARIYKSREVARLREEAKSAATKQAALEDVLPLRDELFAFPNRIEQIGSVSGVTSDFTFGNEDNGKIGYQLTTRGEYTDIVEFVRALEDNIPFMNISSFDIVLAESGYNIHLSGNVFFNGKKE